MGQVMVANHAGGLVPLFLVTNYEKTPGYSMINRLDYKRVIQVTANIDTNTITSQEVNQNMQKHFAEISTKYPGYNVNYGGEEEDRNESMANLMLLFLVALMIIYLVLSSFFRSLILTKRYHCSGIIPHHLWPGRRRRLCGPAGSGLWLWTHFRDIHHADFDSILLPHCGGCEKNSGDDSGKNSGGFHAAQSL